ncbi:MAG: hypothetical protein EOO46_06560 [Flavobacterium sp.]|nr:MAG: hypothetical protein EOO46_06560 [Flavobacterium sp.]
MKKINLIVIAALSVFLYSCEEDDKASFKRENFLVGKWNVTQVGELNSQNKVNYNDYVSCDATIGESFTFTEEQTYTESMYNATEDGCTNKIVTGDFKFENSNILMNYVGNDQKVAEHGKRVIALTYEQMEIVYTDSIANKIIFKKLIKVAE